VECQWTRADPSDDDGTTERAGQRDLLQALHDNRDRVGNFRPNGLTTQGSWKGIYGQDGYIIANDSNHAPAYASLTFGATPAYTWAASTGDVRALVKGGSTTDRIASTYYSSGGNSLTIDVNFTDGQKHQIALYAVDFDNMARAETVSIIDAGTHLVLDSRSLSGFANGAYLVWNVSGHVLVKVMLTGGINAAVSGIFFQPVTVPGPDLTITGTHNGNFVQGQIGAKYSLRVTNSGNGATNGMVTLTDTVPAGLTATSMAGLGWNCIAPAGPCNRSDTLNAGGSYPALTLTVNVASTAPSTVTNTAVVSGGGETNSGNDPASDLTNVTAPLATAAFVTADTTTQGNWKGRYGQDGFIIPNDSNNSPAYAGVSFGVTPGYTWIVSTTDRRALLKSGSMTDRIASTYYTSGSNTFTIDVNVIDGRAHQVALYAADFDDQGRAETISILDAGSQAVLDSRSLTSFTSGTYVAWNISGHVLIRVSLTGGLNAVVNGIFFEPVPAPAPDLAITESHSGNFVQGQTGATYTLSVTNLAARV
jgi:uncharacterized repeat protein (TIGR01451 family)